MLDKRYQVFISASGAEMQPERIILAQTLIGMQFFPWGLERRTPLSTTIARRQIDQCDYVVLLLGSQYGEQSVSGVSYMQLEYIYAVTKQKPIIVFMHAAPELRDANLQDDQVELKEKFQDFRQQLQQEVNQVYTYHSLRDLELAVRYNMPKMLERYPALGWVRPQNIQVLQNKMGVLQDKVSQLEAELEKFENDPLSVIPSVYLHETYTFEYRIHAYRDGNFQELKLDKELSWLHLLTILSAVFKVPAPEGNFAKCINHYLNTTGLEQAKSILPRAHAVANAQISIRALHHIKKQMQQNDWIVPTSRDERQRLQWQFTAKASQLLSNNLKNEHLNEMDLRSEKTNK